MSGLLQLFKKIFATKKQARAFACLFAIPARRSAQQRAEVVPHAERVEDGVGKVFLQILGQRRRSARHKIVRPEAHPIKSGAGVGIGKSLPFDT